MKVAMSNATCVVTLTSIDFMTWRVDTDGVLAETISGPLAITRIDIPVPASPPQGGWSFTGETDALAVPATALIQPLSTGYASGTGIDNLYYNASPTSYAHITYQLTPASSP